LRESTSDLQWPSTESCWKEFAVAEEVVVDDEGRGWRSGGRRLFIACLQNLSKDSRFGYSLTTVFS